MIRQDHIVKDNIIKDDKIYYHLYLLQEMKAKNILKLNGQEGLNKYISKLKIRYTKLMDWIIVITLLYEKTLKQSMVEKKIDEKEALELKKDL